MSSSPEHTMEESDIPATLEMALTLHHTGQNQQAELLCREILDMQPLQPEVLHLLGLIAYQANDNSSAENLIRQAISLAPSAQMFCNLGVLLQASGQGELAIESFHKAISIAPHHADAYFNIGSFYQSIGDLSKAASYYKEAAVIEPTCARAYVNLGVVLYDLELISEAIESYQHALDIDPCNSDASNNLGNALLSLCRFEEAEKNYKRSLMLNPESVEALLNMALVLQVQGKLDQSIEKYRQALTIEPNHPIAHSNLIFTLDMHPALGVTELQKERREWGQTHADKLLEQKTHCNSPVTNRKLRIGYISPDFRQHSAMYVVGCMLMAFDSERFEVYAYSNSNRHDHFTQRLKESVSVWQDVSNLSDQELSDRIRQDTIDILVDPSSHMANNRLLVFARKPAPIQITAWGYIGGTGMKAMDYFFADPVVVPPEEKHLYIEEIIYLPVVANYFSFEAFPPVSVLPAIYGQGITFGSFNRLAKVTPDSLRLWANVLQAIPNSRMVLKTAELDQPSEKERIMKCFIDLGISPDRIDMLGRSSWIDHMRAFNQVDISLDPYPHGGGVTALEGIMMGVPIVSLRHPTIAGRLSAAILTSIGLTDWIAETPDQYVEIAVNKTSGLMALAILRKQLRTTMSNSLVGDSKAYVREVENIYQQLWQRWCSK